MRRCGRGVVFNQPGKLETIYRGCLFNYNSCAWVTVIQTLAGFVFHIFLFSIHTVQSTTSGLLFCLALDAYSDHFV